MSYKFIALISVNSILTCMVVALQVQRCGIYSPLRVSNNMHASYTRNQVECNRMVERSR